ncbi:hypothetical protein JCGZ_03681 [Jatropha curcas]|uniref:Uncharacterized protein n=1 Tax=Jatropha curcas TaxID=180498 RepID=A0A067L5L3_JATCU|nr:hypothetical protein JCGZ_03681 [Jatropha curcas]
MLQEKQICLFCGNKSPAHDPHSDSCSSSTNYTNFKRNGNDSPPPTTPPTPPSYIKASDLVLPVYDILEGEKSTRIDIDVMHHMKIIEKIGDTFRLVRRTVEDDDEGDHAEGDDNNMEEDIPRTTLCVGTFSSVGTSRADTSFQGTSDLSNEEVLARMMSRMDMFDARFQGMEAMILAGFSP